MWWSQRPLGHRVKLYPNKLPLTHSIICFTTCQTGTINSPARSLWTSTDDEPLGVCYHTLLFRWDQWRGFVSTRGKACKRDCLAVNWLYFHSDYSFSLLHMNIPLSVNLPLRYEAKHLKVAPTGTSQQLSMTHVHWKLLSCFIAPSYLPPSIVSYSPLASNKLIDSEQVIPPPSPPQEPVLNPSLPPYVASSHCMNLLHDICPKSWEHKPRREAAKKGSRVDEEQRRKKKRSPWEAAREDVFKSSSSINIDNPV